MNQPISNLTERLYKSTIRPVLPKKLAVANGVAIREPRLFDQTDHFADWEWALVDAICEITAEGDHLVLVGGGHGVSTVRASRAVGEGGRIDAYESSQRMMDILSETVRINHTRAPINTHNAVVGSVTDVAIDAYGSPAGDTPQIPPAELPDADVLVLDCEGAEGDILMADADFPDRLVVECHSDFGSPAEEIKPRLRQMGYRILNERDEWDNNDIIILTARADDKQS